MRTAAAGLVTVIGLIAAPGAAAETPAWNGRYRLIGYANQKGGTSVAARQKEQPFSAEYDVYTSCSGSRCVATLTNGPPPTNPTLPQQLRYAWDGKQWTSVVDWQWECFLGEGKPVQYAPATSWTFYVPQPDGTLAGRWHTDIASGPCRGSVIMPMAAMPVG